MTKDWPSIIKKICLKLDRAGIEYHVDGSASLYVCGLPLENQDDLDDVDMVVNWHHFDDALVVFANHEPVLEIDNGEIKKASFHYYQHPIDLLAYPSPTGIGSAEDRCKVCYQGQYLWSKTPAFYIENNHTDRHLVQQAVQFFISQKR